MIGPIHFVNVARINDLYRRVEKFGDQYHHPSEIPQPNMLLNTTVIIDMENVPSCDSR